MAVSVNNGSLEYISLLNNSDFQSKSLQDIKLIRLRLDLTGDTSGIAKYDAAFKAAAEQEKVIRADLAKILDDAKIKTEQLTAAIEKPLIKTIFTDSAAEAAAYNAELLTTIDGNAILNAQLVDQAIIREKLDTELKLGYLTQEQYNEALISAGIVEGEFAAQTKKATVSAVEQRAVLEELKITLKSLKESQVGASSTQLPIINRQIQETESEIKKFSNVGKVGFDQFGNAIVQTTEKQNKFSAALGRATNLSNIGATVVSRLTRQIIGLGVGLLSFAIGAKAIEALFSYIAGLDAFSGRLDQLKQNIQALKEVNESYTQSAGASISTLKVLYIATTDVTASMESRIDAAKKLKAEYPDAFANATALSIANDKERKSYDDLSASIIANARATAVKTKLDEIAAKQLDIDLKKQEITEKSRALLKTAQGLPTTRSGRNNDADVGGNPRQEAIDIINAGAKAQFLIAEQDSEILSNKAKFLIKYAQGTQKLAEIIEGGANLIKEPLKNFDTIIKNASSEDDYLNLQKALQAKLKSLVPSDADFKAIQTRLRQLQEIIKQYNPKDTDGKAAAKSEEESLLRKLALLNSISDAIRGVNRASLDSDVQALTEISDKFDQLRQRIATFNADPKNKNHKIGASAIADVTAAESTAVTNQANLNENNYIQSEIEKRKQLYADYEAYRLKVGKNIADAEYSDLLKSGKDFETFLKTQVDAVDKNDTSAPIQARREILKKILKDNAEDQKKSLQELLIETASYYDKRGAIIAVREDEIAKLRAKGFNDQANVLQASLNDELTDLDEANNKKTAKYKYLFSGIDTMSTAAAKKYIANAYLSAAASLAFGNITQKAYDDLIRTINKANQAVSDRLPNDLLAVGSALGTIGSQLENVDPLLSSIVLGLGSIVSQVANVNKLGDAFKNADSGVDKFTAGVNLVQAGISAAVSLIDIVTSASDQRKKADEDYYNSVIAFQNQYNIALDEQLRLQSDLEGNIFIKDYKGDLLNAANSLSKVNKQLQDSFIALQAGQAKTGTESVISGKSVLAGAGSGAALGATIGAFAGPVVSLVGGAIGAVIGGVIGLFAGKKKEDTLGPLLGIYPELIKKDKDGVDQFNVALAQNLIQNNLVSDSTKVLLQNTIDLNQERQKAIDQINSDLKDLAGSLGDDLRSALVTAFEDGTDAAKAFGDSVSKVIENIVSQFLFQAVFASQFDQLEANLKASFGIAGDQSATDDIIKFYEQASKLIPAFNKGLQAAKDEGAKFGLDIFGGAENAATSLKGSIKASLTEDTGTILAGTLKGIQLGIYDVTRLLTVQQLSFGQLNILAQSILNNAILIEINTRRTALNTDTLPFILTELQGINSNSSGSLGVALRAAGKFGY